MNTQLAFIETRSPAVDVVTLEYILLGDLRDLLEEPFDEVTLRWLKAVLDALLDTLPREFALKDNGGYLSEVIDCDPSWSLQVQRLAEERRAVYHTLRTLRLQLRTTTEPLENAGEVQNALKNWMTSLTAFHRHERRLVQTAFNLDVGIGD